MFERLPNAPYWRRLVGCHLRSNGPWSQANCRMLVLGWEVWAKDGKAYLFREGRNHCLRADWFQFCEAVRRWIHR